MPVVHRNDATTVATVTSLLLVWGRDGLVHHVRDIHGVIACGMGRDPEPVYCFETDGNIVTCFNCLIRQWASDACRLFQFEP